MGSVHPPSTPQAICEPATAALLCNTKNSTIPAGPSSLLTVPLTPCYLGNHWLTHALVASLFCNITHVTHSFTHLHRKVCCSQNDDEVRHVWCGETHDQLKVLQQHVLDTLQAQVQASAVPAPAPAHQGYTKSISRTPQQCSAGAPALSSCLVWLLMRAACLAHTFDALTAASTAIHHHPQHPATQLSAQPTKQTANKPAGNCSQPRTKGHLASQPDQ